MPIFWLESFSLTPAGVFENLGYFRISLHDIEYSIRLPRCLFNPEPELSTRAPRSFFPFPPRLA